MKLIDFRYALPKQVIVKGAALLAQGRVLDLVTEADGVWQAVVDAVEDIYTVRVETIERGELECSCTCVDDEYDYCPHVVAVLLQLEALIAEGKLRTKKAKQALAKKKETKPEKLRRLLARLPPEAVLDILIQLAEQDSALLNRLMVQVDEGKAKPADFRRLVKDALRSERGSEGFLTAAGSTRAARKIEGLLAQAEQARTVGDNERAVMVAQVFVDELAAIFGKADDSNNSLKELFERAVGLLQQVSREGTGNERAALLDWFLERGDREPFRGMGLGSVFLGLAIQMVADAGERDHVMAALDGLQARYSYRRPYPGYRAGLWMEDIVLLKLVLVARFDGPQAARAFLIEYQHLHQPRMALIKLYIENDEIAAAYALIEQGQKEAKKTGARAQQVEYFGLQIELLERTGDTDGLIRVARDVWVVTRNAEDYARMKARVPPENWPDYRKKLAVDLEKQPDVVAWMWAEEGQWEELLKLVKNRPELMRYHRPTLEENFPVEMANLYEREVQAILKRGSEYRAFEIPPLIQYMKRVGETVRADALVAVMRKRYADWPALMKVLRIL
jgi:hypothetical protein